MQGSDQASPHRNPITIWVVDDHPDFRETVQDLIRSTPDMVCPFTFASCEEVLKAIHHHSLPDIILMDINFPGHMSGIEGTRRLQVAAPDVRVVMLTMHLEDDIIFDALRSGAYGCLFKMSPPEKIVEGVLQARKGGMMMPSPIMQRILDALSTSDDYDARLTQRETETLQLLVQNVSKEQIAERLHVAKTAIENHIHNIYRKLHRT